MSGTPNYVFEGTPAQKAYAAEMVHNRVRAETRLTTAKAALWWLGGIGLFLALLGVGLGTAFWGYSRVADITNTAEHLADTLKTVLEKVTVETRGEIKVSDGETIGVDPNATVGIESGGSVKIEPGGTVRLEGGAVAATASGPSNSTRPTPAQMQGTGSYDADSGGNIVTDFTVFKNVKYSKGQVTTGWKYHSNTDTVPFREYCYYQPFGENALQTIIGIAEDGKMSSPSENSPIDQADAASKCVWFNGSRTQMSAAAPSTAAPSAESLTTTYPNTSIFVPNASANTTAPTSPSTTDRINPPLPRFDAKFEDWQQWCRATYPATIQEWCLSNFGPGAKMVIRPTPETPTKLAPPSSTAINKDPNTGGPGPLRMDPSKVKSF